MTPISPLKNLRLYAQIALWRYGLAWPIAIVCMLVAVVMQHQKVQPDQVALARSRQVPAVSHLQLIPPAGLATPETNGHLALQALVLAAPPDDEHLRLLSDLAKVASLTLTRADYQRRPLPAVPLLQWQVTQPVQADYPAIRRYLEAVLHDLPNASLDEITVHRDDIGQGQVQARLRWSLWLPACKDARSPCTLSDRPAGASTITASVRVAPSNVQAAESTVIALIPRDALFSPIAPTARAHFANGRDLFAARSWTPPPAPQAPAASAPPTAPTPPFTYLGKKFEDGRWEVYVQHQDRSLVLHEGITHDAVWRVDQIGTTTLTLTYLPLGQTRTLAIGDHR